MYTVIQQHHRVTLLGSSSSNSPQFLHLLLAHAGKCVSDSGRLECNHNSYSHGLSCLGLGGVFRSCFVSNSHIDRDISNRHLLSCFGGELHVRLIFALMLARTLAHSLTSFAAFGYIAVDN